MDDLAHRWQQAQLEYQREIKTIARNSSYVSQYHDVEDMEQELLVVLWETCALYDPDRGMTFKSFFYMRAKQKIGMLSDYSKTQKRTADLISLDAASYTAEIDSIEAARPQPSAEEEALLRLEAQHMARRAGVGKQWEKQIEKCAG